MSIHEAPSSRRRPPVRSARPVVRSVIALAVLVFGICANAQPGSATAPTVPDAPTISGVTIGQNSVSVAFDANADGGSAITGYTVTCDSSDGGTTRSATDTSSPITVSALTNGNTYSCTVVATNSVGDSAASDPSDDIVAVNVPDAPTINSLTRGSNSAIVAFTPNSDGGDAIIFSKVTCTSSTGGTTRTKTGLSSPLTVTSLSNGRTYTCTVTSTNSIGESAPSVASSAFVAGTTPAAPTIAGVVRGDNSAIVSITPHSTGGIPLTNYTAACTSSDGGAPGLAFNATSPVTIASLTNGKTYTCTAFVTNALGNSASSAASSSFVVATMPDAPTLGAVVLGSNSVSVAVTANADGGDTITGFTVTCTSSDGGATQSATGATSPVTVGALSNGHTYTCTAGATNGIGDSVASTATSPFVVVGVPDAPTITSLDLDRNAAILGFVPGGDGGDTVTGFTATCTSSDGGTTRAATDTTSPLTVSSLTNGGTYTCAIVATNSYGDSVASDSSSDFVAGDLPAAPTIDSITRGNNSVTVAVTSAGDGGNPITSYRVTCRSSDGGLTRSRTGATSPITVDRLSNGRTYTCKVVASNDSGDSAASSASSSFVAGTVPPAPTVNSVTRGANSAIVAFTSNGSGGSAITGFTATCTSSDGGTTRSATGASSPLTVGSLTSGNTYTCTVVATNAINDSPASVASTSFVAADLPAAPTIGLVARGNNSGIVAFTPNSAGGDTVTSFTATCTSSDGGTTQSASGATSPITVTTLTNGKTYTCSVVATNALGNSAASAASTSFVSGTVPDAPTLGSVVRGTANTATVAFTANGSGGSAITSFTATCTSSDGGTTRSATGATSPLTVANLTNAKTYTCSVVATNGTGDGAASTASSSFVAADLPAAPTVGVVTRGNNSASVAFTANSDGGDTVTAFTVTCASSDGGTTQAASGATSPVVVSSLTNTKTYTCTVLATNALGNSAASAASISFVAATVAAAPTLGSVTRGANSATVAFTPNGNGGSAIVSFTVTCTSSDGGTTRAATGATSPLTVTTLTNGKTYTCSAVATNTVGDSTASAASASFVAATNPSAPTITGVTLGNNAGVVAFTAGSDGADPVTAFTVTCTSSDGGTTRSQAGTTSPITVATLTNGKTYTCTMLATNALGNSPVSVASSSFVAATVPVAPSAPTITAITHTAGQVVITFTPGANGGSAITGFTATCIPTDASATRTASGSKSPLTVTGLTVGVHYLCRVSATNAIGTSADSNPFGFTD